MDKNKMAAGHVEGQIEGLNFATEILKQLKDTIKRQWILLVIILSLWVATIGGFIWYLNQYDFTSTSIDADQDGEGINIVGGGNVDYGPSGEADNQKAD